MLVGWLVLFLATLVREADGGLSCVLLPIVAQFGDRSILRPRCSTYQVLADSTRMTLPTLAALSTLVALPALPALPRLLASLALMALVTLLTELAVETQRL